MDKTVKPVAESDPVFTKYQRAPLSDEDKKDIIAEREGKAHNRSVAFAAGLATFGITTLGTFFILNHLNRNHPLLKRDELGVSWMRLGVEGALAYESNGDVTDFPMSPKVEQGIEKVLVAAVGIATGWFAKKGVESVVESTLNDHLYHRLDRERGFRERTKSSREQAAMVVRDL